MDILSDVVTNSEYNPALLEVERGTILREMEEVEGQMNEVIFDRLHETAYRGSMLGRTILGSVENIRSITRDQIVDFVGAHYTAPRMVLAAAGAVDHNQLVDLTTKFFGKVPTVSKRPIKMEPAAFTGSDIRDRFDDMPEAHVALAFPTAGWNDPDTYTLMVIQHLLGSWDGKVAGSQYHFSKMISAIAAEKLASNVLCFNTQYSDTGLFGVFASGCPYTTEDLMHHITRAITNLSYNCDSVQLTAAKNQTKMALLSTDNSSMVAEDIGRQVLQYGRRMHVTEVLARIEAVDAAAIKNCATRYFYDRDHALAAVGSIYGIPDYNWIRRRSYWLRY